MGRNKEDRARLFSLISTVKVFEHRNGMPREVVESPSSEVIQNPTGHVLGNLL